MMLLEPAALVTVSITEQLPPAVQASGPVLKSCVGFWIVESAEAPATTSKSHSQVAGLPVDRSLKANWTLPLPAVPANEKSACGGRTMLIVAVDVSVPVGVFSVAVIVARGADN